MGACMLFLAESATGFYNIPNLFFQTLMNASRFWPLFGALLIGVTPAFGQGGQPFGAAGRGPGSQEAFVRMVRHNDGSRTVTSKHSGNATGKGVDEHIQLVQTYDKNGELRLERSYKLSTANGQPDTFTIYNGNRQPLLLGRFTYDAFGRMQTETLFSAQTRKEVRRLTQGYDYSGKKLPPKVENFEALPADILYWMDPDSAPASAQKAMAGGAGAKGASGKKGGILGIFGKKP